MAWTYERAFGVSHQKPIWRDSGYRVETEEEAAVLADTYEQKARAQGVEVDTRLREIACAKV